MNRKPPAHQDSLEHDAVWKLLDQAPPATVSPRFTDDTVRAARLAGQPEPWWKCLFSPAPLAGLAAATAALAFALPSLTTPAAPQSHAILDSSDAAAIQDIAETETLIAAADHLDDFSDVELVSLIGF